MKTIGAKLGMVMSVMSFAALTGTPIAGALFTAAGSSFLLAQIFAAASMIVGTVLIAMARYFRVGLSGKAKV